MAKNGYFQLECIDGKMWFRAFAPVDGGKMFETDEVVQYLDKISFPDYNLVEIDGYIQKQNFEEPFLLADEEIIPEGEKCVITFSERDEKAYARFYPPTTGGAMLTTEDIVSDLKFAGVKHGIHKKAIQHFLEKREYCRTYIMAEATYPVEGKDASIEYFFDINVTAKPKLKDDGSVDFHNLGNIAVVEKGTKLAELTPADSGRNGLSVKGKPLPPKKVKRMHLRHGRNIRMSDDKCRLYAEVSGYATLVDDMVMLSDVYRVPANVDASTGDIHFDGTVEVAGNVNTGFAIETSGDIVVNGVVEGASLKAGGNIVIKRGMQGMERGELQAGGNITAKFLENCKVRCEGGLKADAVLHSDVDCKEDIEVRGKKGLVNGGHIRTYGKIHATSLGSTMGTSTKVEVKPDKDLILKKNEIQEKIDMTEQTLQKFEKIAESVKAQLSLGREITKEQRNYIKQATQSKPAMTRELRELKHEKTGLQSLIENNRLASVYVEKEVYAGVKIVVKDAMKIQNEHLSHCRFVREGADVKMVGL
jgi:hypothetical protein